MSSEAQGKAGLGFELRVCSAGSGQNGGGGGGGDGCFLPREVLSPQGGALTAQGLPASCSSFPQHLCLPV